MRLSYDDGSELFGRSRRVAVVTFESSSLSSLAQSWTSQPMPVRIPAFARGNMPAGSLSGNAQQDTYRAIEHYL